MTTVDVVLLVGLVSVIVTFDPLTAVTNPEAPPNAPPALTPAGRLPVPAVPEPPPTEGGAPAPEGACPVDPAPDGRVPPPPPNPVEHLPDTGCVTDTVVAVTGPVVRALVEEEVELEAGLPNAEMQDPTVTADIEPVVVC